MADWTGPLDELLTALEAKGVFASLDPAEVNTPGGWLAVDELAPANVRGDTRIRCSLFLISDDRDHRRAMNSLGDLYLKALEVLTPDGPVVTQGVVLPDSPTPLPGLRVPVDLYKTRNEA